jgi:hypothetical protein
MEAFFVIAVIFVFLIIYLNSTRVERKKRHFQSVLNKTHIKAETKRTFLVRLRQKSNVKRLCIITKNELNKFRMELPPRIYIEVNSLIEDYTKNQEFNKLFLLYNFLITSINKTILKNLQDFKK